MSKEAKHIVDVESGGKPVVHDEDDVKGGALPGATAGRNRGRLRSRRAAHGCVLYRVFAMLVLVSGVVAFVAAVWFYFGWMFAAQLGIVVVVVVAIINNVHRWLYVALVTAPRDIT